MAKMFYTLDEVCSKLGKTESEVEALVESGQIQEFRDGESLVFKVEQINLLAEPDDVGGVDLDLDDSALDLDDSFGLGESGTRHPLAWRRARVQNCQRSPQRARRQLIRLRIQAA